MKFLSSFFLFTFLPIFSSSGSDAMPLQIIPSDLRDGTYLSNRWPLVASTDGKTFVQPTDIGVILWDVKTGRRIRTLPTEVGLVSAAVSPDGTRILGGELSLIRRDSAHIHFWDLKNGIHKVLPGHRDSKHLGDYPPYLRIDYVAFLSDARIAISWGSDGMARYWNLETYMEIVSMPCSDSLRYNSYEPAVFAHSTDGMLFYDSVDLWDVPNQKKLGPLEGTDVQHPVEAVRFSPNGELIAASVAAPKSEPRKYGIWETSTRRKVLALEHSSTDVLGFQFSPDGTTLMSIGCNPTIIWNAETGKRIGQIDSFSSLLLHPDGDKIFGIRSEENPNLNNRISLWRLADLLQNPSSAKAFQEYR